MLTKCPNCGGKLKEDTSCSSCGWFSISYQLGLEFVDGAFRKRESDNAN